MKILVTGASGFVGGHIALGLAQAGEELFALGGSRLPGPELCRICAHDRLDLTDAEAVEQLLKRETPGAVIHAAALARGDACEKDPAAAEAANAAAAANLAAACASLARPPLLAYVSTDLVFEGRCAPAGGFVEDDVPAPVSVYAKTKLRGEKLVRGYPGPHVILRICLAYGRPINGCTGFLGWLRARLAAGEEVALFGDEWRTPVFVDDVTAVVHKLILNCRTPDRCSGSRLPAVLHAAGPERVNRYELGLKTAAAFGLNPQSAKCGSRMDFAAAVFRAEDVSLSCGLIGRELGIMPRDCSSGLALTAQQCADSSAA